MNKRIMWSLWLNVLLGTLSRANAEPFVAVAATPQPSYSFQPTSIESLRRSITCHVPREFPQPGATGRCLSYTTGPAFSEDTPGKGIRVDPVRLGVEVGSPTAEMVFRYPSQGIPKSTMALLSKRRASCPQDAKTDIGLECLGKQEKNVLSTVLPKQVMVVDGKTGQFETHPVLSFSRDQDDPIYEYYHLKTIPFERFNAPGEPASIIAFGLKAAWSVSRREQPPLGVIIDELLPFRLVRESLPLHQIPRFPGWGAPEIRAMPYPGIAQTSLQDLGDLYETSRPTAAGDLLVILRSQAVEARLTPAETWCDLEGNYWLPTWTGFFLVQNNTWHLLYDEIKDLRQDLLTTLLFIDLNDDGRRDLIIGRGESDDRIILTSEGKALRKWGEGEVSPCGC